MRQTVALLSLFVLSGCGSHPKPSTISPVPSPTPPRVEAAASPASEEEVEVPTSPAEQAITTFGKLCMHLGKGKVEVVQAVGEPVFVSRTYDGGAQYHYYSHYGIVVGEFDLKNRLVGSYLTFRLNADSKNATMLDWHGDAQSVWDLLDRHAPKPGSFEADSREIAKFWDKPQDYQAYRYRDGFNMALVGKLSNGVAVHLDGTTPEPPLRAEKTTFNPTTDRYDQGPLKTNPAFRWENVAVYHAWAGHIAEGDEHLTFGLEYPLP